MTLLLRQFSTILLNFVSHRALQYCSVMSQSHTAKSAKTFLTVYIYIVYRILYTVLYSVHCTITSGQLQKILQYSKRCETMWQGINLSHYIFKLNVPDIMFFFMSFENNDQL